MVSGGRWVVTEDEAKRRRADALLAEREALTHLALLHEETDEAAAKLFRLASLFRDVRGSRDILHGPLASILALPETEYSKWVDMGAIRALANETVRSKRAVAELKEKLRALGL